MPEPKQGGGEEEEDDCGFRFRRQSKRPRNEEAPRALPQEPAAETSLTTADPPAAPPRPSQSQQQQQQQQKRRRRSSFAAIASRTSGRPSALCSFAVSLSSKLPPANVPTSEYYKHLMPDLPGPIKMRQLMIWAVQRAAARQADAPALQELAGRVQDALLNNQINTSWYQRPASSTVDSNASHSRSSKGQEELQDCIQLYERYAQRLRLELSQWQQLEESLTTHPAIVPRTPESAAPPTPSGSSSSPTDDAHVESRALLNQASHWFRRLPETTEEIHWTLSVAANFETHARSYCEGVFHQISARLFGGHVRPTPIALLRALSSTAVSTGN